eukprot:g42573.t1
MIIPGYNGCSWCSIKDNLRYYRNWLASLVCHQDVLPEHREAWQSSAMKTFALQLSVKMQRFAASLKQQPLLQLKNNCLKDFQ